MIHVTLMRTDADGAPLGREFVIPVNADVDDDMAVEVAIDKAYRLYEADRFEDLLSGESYELRGVKRNVYVRPSFNAIQKREENC